MKNKSAYSLLKLTNSYEHDVMTSTFLNGYHIMSSNAISVAILGDCNVKFFKVSLRNTISPRCVSTSRLEVRAAELVKDIMHLWLTKHRDCYEFVLYTVEDTLRGDFAHKGDESNCLSSFLLENKLSRALGNAPFHESDYERIIETANKLKANCFADVAITTRNHLL